MPKKKQKKPTEKRTTALSSVEKKIDLILEQQKLLLEKQNILQQEEKRIEEKEKKIETLEIEEKKEEERIEKVAEEEESTLQQLEELEKEIKQEVKRSPLKKITYRDFTKGMIGAFIGIVAHFSFLEGLDVAENFTMLRASLLYFIAFLIGVSFLYFSGFRSVEDKTILKIIPLRILVIYASAIFVTFIVLAVFGIITMQSNFEEVYKTIAAISILAILGACTADLMGKE
ncbi:DUF2391 family protein [Candidatus Woesearchaeota archaeon]|nr:DUF2391 family protein [Candidatus Woesearchaeota archaeon]